MQLKVFRVMPLFEIHIHPHILISCDKAWMVYSPPSVIALVTSVTSVNSIYTLQRIIMFFSEILNDIVTE